MKNIFKKVSVPDYFVQDFNEEILNINIQGSRIIALFGAILVPLFFFTGIDYLFAPDKYLYFLGLRIVLSIYCFCIYLKLVEIRDRRYFLASFYVEKKRGDCYMFSFKKINSCMCSFVAK